MPVANYATTPPQLPASASSCFHDSEKDHGIGIDASHHERIFGLFARLDPTREGTGIGLALVRRIVEGSGGSI